MCIVFTRPHHMKITYINICIYTFLIQQVAMMSWTHFQMFLFISFLGGYFVNVTKFELCALFFRGRRLVKSFSLLWLTSFGSFTLLKRPNSLLVWMDFFDSLMIFKRATSTRTNVLIMAVVCVWVARLLVTSWQFRKRLYHPGLDHWLFLHLKPQTF